MSISREIVVSAYKLLLGRDPENEFVIEQAMHCENREQYLKSFFGSAEFRAKNPGLVPQSNAWVWAEPAGDFLLKVNLSDNAIAWPAIENQFEPTETAFMRAHLKTGHQVIDIGANVGYFTMLMASLVGPTGRVHSFEPIPKLFAVLSQSVKQNRFDDFVTVSNHALSDANGEMSMIFATVTDNWGGAHFSAADTVQDGHTVVTVQTDKLDSLQLASVDFMKIDVEGAEPKVFSGAKGTIEKWRPVVLSEVHPEALGAVSNCTPADYLGLFEGIGYDCCSLDHGGKLGGKLAPAQVDKLMNVIFVPSEFGSAAARLAASTSETDPT